MKLNTGHYNQCLELVLLGLESQVNFQAGRIILRCGRPMGMFDVGGGDHAQLWRTAIEGACGAGLVHVARQAAHELRERLAKHVKALGDENPSINYAYSMRFFYPVWLYRKPLFFMGCQPF